MKKYWKNTGIVLIALITFSFTTEEEEIKEVKKEKSMVTWKGYKVTGSHEGTIEMKSGQLTFDDGELVGGEFTIDMTTITNTDLSGEYKEKLEGHLRSDDFFSVDEHPTSTMVIREVKSTAKNAYEVKGDLTIKGITKPITFDLSVYGNKATANLKVDRTKYDIRYGSTSFFDDLADKAIYDEFELISEFEFQS